MKRQFHTLFAAAAATAVFVCGCRVRDVRTATIRVPGLDEAHLSAVESELSKLPDSRLTNKRGDRSMCMSIVSFDPATGDLTIRYDSMKVGVKNLEEAISLAGFDTPTFPAVPPEKRRSGRGG